MSGSRFASIKKSVPDELSLGATVTENQAADLARSASFDVLEKEAHSDSPATEFAAVSGLRPRSEAPAVGEVHSGIAAGEAAQGTEATGDADALVAESPRGRKASSVTSSSSGWPTKASRRDAYLAARAWLAVSSRAVKAAAASGRQQTVSRWTGVPG